MPFQFDKEVYFYGETTNCFRQSFNKFMANSHVYIYISIFPELIFAPRYPILIFIWLIVLCLLFSFVINAIYFPILKKTVGKNVLIVDKQHDKPSEIKISG